MSRNTNPKASLTKDFRSLLRERWALATVLLAFTLLVAVVVGWFLARPPTAPLSTAAPAAESGTEDACVVRLLVETEKGGAQWLTLKPKNDELGGVEFEELTIIRKAEIRGCQ